MVAVTWLGAHAYCLSLGARLPTEAEWELAARAEKRTLFVGGDDRPSCADAVFGRDGERKGAKECASQRDRLVEVGAADRRGSEILHLGDNVSEWVADYLVEDDSKRARYARCASTPCVDYYVAANGKPGPRPNPDDVGAPGSLHPIRGCSFLDPAGRCVAAVRSYDAGYELDPSNQGATNPHVGFRCARSKE